MEGILDDLNDLQFILRLIAGNQDAFTVLFDQFSPKVCGFIQAQFRLSHQDSEQIAADAMFKVHKSIQRFNPKGKAKLTTWIIEIAKNTAIDHIRQQTAQAKKLLIEVKSMDSENLSDNRYEPRYDDGSEEEVTPRNLKTRKAFESLSENDQDLIRMKEVMSYEDISQTLEAEVSTLRVRYKRALDRLKQAYGPEDDNG
jgi:RNA polymerase sigma factor (sigma-70 family)